MSTTAGVGYSEKANSAEAAKEATAAALEQAGIERPDVVLMFSTAKHDPRKFHEGVRSLVGDKTRLFGGYAGGIITQDKLGYDGYQVGIAVLKSDTVKFDTFLQEGLKAHGEHETGRRFGAQLKAMEYEGQPGLVYGFDAVSRFSEDGFDLNKATPFIRGVEESIGTWPPAAGMGMIGNIQFNPTFQFYNDQVVQQAAVGMMVHGGSCRMDTAVMHGCKPASDYHTVTKAEGNVVLEIDGKPALEKIQEMLGPSEKSWEDYPLFIVLGMNRGDKYGEYREEDYASMLTMAIDKERKALVMFDPGIKTGDEVQLMRRNLDDFGYVAKRSEGLLEGLNGRKPFFAIYIDCMARAAAYCGVEREEAEEVQKIIGSRVPLLGFFTGVEIGRVGNIPQQALDVSGVLCVFSVPEG